MTGLSAAWDPAWWPAPAKLNLMLRITGRRADGYHQLQTVFQFLDWGDELDFCVTADPEVVLETATKGVEPDHNLVILAARQLQTEADCSLGVRIRLRKRIPMGGGLGGGSSDAATTLVALNRLWRLGFSNEQLQELGLRLGADVPVFVAGHAAWAEGVGERLQVLQPAESWYVVLKPAADVSTGLIFADPDLTRSSPPGTMADFLRHGGGNDCEAVVRCRYPEVGEALDWLSRYAHAQLTGTGACVFAAFDGRERAEHVLQRLPSRWRAYAHRGINRSPLLKRIEI